MEDFAKKSQAANEHIAQNQCDKGGKIFGGMLNEILESEGLEAMVKR